MIIAKDTGLGEILNLTREAMNTSETKIQLDLVTFHIMIHI